MSFELLTVERRDNVALVTLNRAEKRNALSIALRDDLDACLKQIEDDESLSVAVLTGAGSVFCAGFDTSEFVPQMMQEVAASSDRFHRRLIEFRKPLVAAVNGPAMGGGLDLAMLCDIRISADRVAFAHPEIKFGAPILFGPLAEIIGGGLARDLCLTGRRIDAEEAFRIGLVSKVVPADRLLDEALDYAATIAEAPLAALKATKKMIIDTYSWEMAEGAGTLEGITPSAR